MEMAKKLAFGIKLTYYLTLFAFFVIWESTPFGRRSYVGYYDWPNRSLEEYRAARDSFAARKAIHNPHR